MLRLHKAVNNYDRKKVKKFLALGDNINETSQIESLNGSDSTYLMTPLHLAAYKGDTTMSELLIDAHASLDLRSSNNETALEIAVGRGHLDLAKILKKAGASDEKDVLNKALTLKKMENELFDAVFDEKINVIRDYFVKGILDKKLGETTLRKAVIYNKLSIVQELILVCGVSVNACSDQKPLTFSDEFKTPLGIAAEYGHDVIAEFLLANDAEVDKYTHITPFLQETTPLRMAIIHPDRESNPRLVELLLGRGADIKKINEHGMERLCSMGDSEDLAVLLKYGLDPNTVVEGKSLLDRCMSRVKQSMAVQLIQYGASVEYVNKKGESYLHRSRDVSLTKLLLEKGLHPELKDAHGKTPIECVDKQSAEFLAVRGVSINKLSMLDNRVLASPQLTQQLIEEKIADFNLTNNKGRTPLRKLARNANLKGYLETLKLILSTVLDLDINQQSTVGGWTALHEAFCKNKGFTNFSNSERERKQVSDSEYTIAIDLLIALGASPLKDKGGRTPLMCMNFDGLSSGFNRAVIERYYKFEADFYKVDPEIYKKELIQLRGTGFGTVKTFFYSTPAPYLGAIEKFWEKISSLSSQNLSDSPSLGFKFK